MIFELYGKYDSQPFTFSELLNDVAVGRAYRVLRFSIRLHLHTMEWATKPIRRLNKQRWPCPRDSTGVWIRAIGKRHGCWAAIGPVRNAFDHLGKEIKDYLERCSDPVPQTVTWSIYMIGRTQDSVTPTVIFSCSELNPRKEVRRIIKESGILDRYPGIELGDSSSPPDCDNLVPLAVGDIMEDALLPPLEAKKIDPSIRPDDPFARSIFIINDDGDSHSLRKSTAGGIVCFKDRVFYFTAAHPFAGPTDMKPADRENIAFECDFDGQSDTDGEGDDDLDVNTTSRGSMTPEDVRERYGLSPDDESDVSTQALSLTSTLDTNPSPPRFGNSIGEPVSTTRDDGVPQQPLDEPWSIEVAGKLALTSSNGPNPSLDYALVEIMDPRFPLTQKAFLKAGLIGSRLSCLQMAKTESDDVDIMTTTSSGGILRGKLHRTPLYMRLPNSGTFQATFPVRLDGRLADGDCGSWVFDNETGELCGHIVAGSPGTGSAYIIPANQVLEELQQRLGGDVTLFTFDALQPPPKKAIVCLNVLPMSPGPQPSSALRSVPQSKTKGKRERSKSASTSDFASTNSRAGFSNFGCPSQRSTIDSSFLSELRSPLRRMKSQEVCLSGDYMAKRRQTSFDRKGEYKEAIQPPFHPYLGPAIKLEVQDLSFEDYPSQGFRYDEQGDEGKFEATRQGTYRDDFPTTVLESSFDETRTTSNTSTYSSSSTAPTTWSRRSRLSSVSTNLSAPMAFDTFTDPNPVAWPWEMFMSRETSTMPKPPINQSIELSDSIILTPKSVSNVRSRRNNVQHVGRPKMTSVFCPFCDDHKEGFHGDHELRRHIDRAHKGFRKVWICQDISPDRTFLANCPRCRNRKAYGADYNAAAHLRRVHFNAAAHFRGGGKGAFKSRGGIWGADVPPMDVLRDWILEISEGSAVGALSDEPRFLGETGQLSNFEPDHGCDPDYNDPEVISQVDLDFVEKTTHVDMSFYRQPSPSVQSPFFPEPLV